VPVLYCHVLTTYKGNEKGDGGSPVYQLVPDSSGVPIGVKAYGVISGKTTYYMRTPIGLPLPIPATVVADLWLPQRVDVTAR